jgi:hypothetical protein
MHFEILVEDASGKVGLELLIPKIIGVDSQHTWKVFAYKGIGRIPEDLRSNSDPKKRILLDQLPRLIQGYGRTFKGYGPDYDAALIVVCDLDERCLSKFRQELLALAERCNSHAKTRFCIAIKEGEAWYLGDKNAIKRAYPGVDDSVFESYDETTHGTWETLADMVIAGGSKLLKTRGYPDIGVEKEKWAEAIAPNLNVEENTSPSFQYFRDTLRQLIKSCK